MVEVSQDNGSLPDLHTFCLVVLVCWKTGSRHCRYTAAEASGALAISAHGLLNTGPLPVWHSLRYFNSCGCRQSWGCSHYCGGSWQFRLLPWTFEQHKATLAHVSQAYVASKQVNMAQAGTVNDT